MESGKIISSLCYFSIFFAPFLLPLIVFFVVDDREVKLHAKSALISHLIPAALIIVSLLGVVNMLGRGMMPLHIPLIGFGFFGLFGLLSFIVTIWNVVRGIRVLVQ